MKVSSFFFPLHTMASCHLIYVPFLFTSRTFLSPSKKLLLSELCLAFLKKKKKNRKNKVLPSNARGTLWKIYESLFHRSSFFKFTFISLIFLKITIYNDLKTNIDANWYGLLKYLPIIATLYTANIEMNQTLNRVIFKANNLHRNDKHSPVFY